MHTYENVIRFCNTINFRPGQTNSEIKILHTILHPDEELKYILEGNLKKIHNRNINGIGLAITTNKRVIFLRKSIIGTLTNEDVLLSKISAVSNRKGILLSSVTVTTSNNEATIDNCNKTAADIFTNITRNELNNSNSISQEKNTIQNTPSKYDELEKIFEFKSKGIISEEEYNIEKRRILNQ